MAAISFRDRKHKNHIDASFSLFNGQQLGDVARYLTGDIVHVCFSDQHAKQKAITDNRPCDFPFGGSDGLIHIPCVVVKRRHTIVWRGVGKFEELIGCGVVLEAETGYWEDVLKWIICDTRPEWISDTSSS